jgi:hypothetical protein
MSMDSSYITVDHPCLRRTKVPLYVRAPAKAGSQDLSPEALEMIAYIFRDVPIQPEEA